MSAFDIKNIIIFILVIILLFMMIGINIIDFISNLIEYIAETLKPVLGSILSAFAYLTGTTINTTTDVVSDTAKTGIDIVEDTIQSVGNILIDVSNREDNKTEVSDKIENQKKMNLRMNPNPIQVKHPFRILLVVKNRIGV
jgi:hypothetical protein